jgi:type 1 fimbria pilin
MKKTFFIAACMMLLSSLSIAQKYNNELLKSYTKSEIQSMDVETLQALEYGVENAIYFIAIPKEKQSNFLGIKNPNSSSKYTDLGLKIMNENQYFEIKETNQLMVVKSLFVLKNELINKHKN